MIKKIIILYYLLIIGAFGFAQNNSIDKLIVNGELKEALELTNKLDVGLSKFNYLGTIYLQKGQYDEAKKQFLLGLETHEANNKPLAVAQCYSNVAISEFALGNQVKSLEFHFRALAIREKENNEADIAASFNDIGLAYFDIDEDKALQYYEKALAIYEKIYDPSDDKVAAAYTNMGILYSKMELFGDAILNLEKALEIRKQVHGEEHTSVAIVFSALGITYNQMGESSTAIEFLEKALSIYQKTYGSKHPEIASTLNQLGYIYINEETYKKAIESFHQAIIANTLDYNSADIYSLPKIEANYYNGDYLLNSLQQKAKAFEAYHYGQTLKLKDLQIGLSYIELSDQLIDELRQQKTTENDKIKLGNTATEVYEDGIRVSLAVADVSWIKKDLYKKAFYFSEKSKSAVLLDAIAETNAKSFANIPDDLLIKEQTLKTEIAYYQQQLAAKPDKSKEETIRKTLFEYNNEYEKFSKQLELQFPDYYNLKYNMGLPSIEEIQETINVNTAVLSYFIGSERLYIFQITKNDFKTFNISAGNNFERSLSGFRNSIYYGIKDSYVSIAYDLYNQLIPKLNRSIDQLIIIPAGKLGIIPFEALLTSKTKGDVNYSALPYLINDYTVSVQYSTALLVQPIEEMTSDNNVCLVAPITFPDNNLPSLPATANEVNAIASIFNSNNLTSSNFTKLDATENNIKSLKASNSKFVHFATHGIVNEDKPELSQIFLSSDQQDDGNLYSGEIYNLSLNADLVTLSACQTGLGKIHKGEGIVGLSRALIYSGANNLVVSLWSVADASTSDLMIDFYTEIIENNKSYSIALQQAKKKMILSQSYNAPYYWAPFELIGK